MNHGKKKRRGATPVRRKVRQDARNQPVTIFLSVSEREMLDYFVKKYRLSSRSGYIRGLVMRDVLSHVYDDMPSLFDSTYDDTSYDECDES